MCFCQYVLHREQIEATTKTMVDHVIGHMVNMRKSALKKTHHPRQNFYVPVHHTPQTDSVYSTSRNSGKTEYHHQQRKPTAVTFMREDDS